MLTDCEYDMLMELDEPYIHLITFNTQLLSNLTICRHGLRMKFMTFIMVKSMTSVQRIFNGWVIF